MELQQRRTTTFSRASLVKKGQLGLILGIDLPIEMQRSIKFNQPTVSTRQDAASASGIIRK